MIKVVDVSLCVIIFDKLIIDVFFLFDFVILVSVIVILKRKNNDVYEGEKLMEIELRDVNVLERIMIRNSKCVKLEEYNEDG